MTISSFCPFSHDEPRTKLCASPMAHGCSCLLRGCRGCWIDPGSFRDLHLGAAHEPHVQQLTQDGSLGKGEVCDECRTDCSFYSKQHVMCQSTGSQGGEGWHSSASSTTASPFFGDVTCSLKRDCHLRCSIRSFEIICIHLHSSIEAERGSTESMIALKSSPYNLFFGLWWHRNDMSRFQTYRHCFTQGCFEVFLVKRYGMSQ